VPATSTHLATWIVNQDVKIWWISGTGAVPSTGEPSAYGASGALLPFGNDARPGVG
jgi:hypothetical protein